MIRLMVVAILTFAAGCGAKSAAAPESPATMADLRQGLGSPGKKAAVAEPEKWLRPGEEATVGDVSVAFVSAELKPMPDSDEQAMIVTLSLHNSSATRKIAYTSRVRQSGQDVSMNDEFGNAYGGADVTTATGSGSSLYPGKDFQVTLGLEQPVGKAKRLRVVYPAAAFGEPGVIGFEIPADKITRH